MPPAPLILVFLVGASALLATLWRLLGARPRAQRGARIVAPMPWHRWRGGCAMLAGVRLTPQDEVRHFKLIGATGAGKSTAIRELLTRALERGDRVIVADPDGSYQRRFFDPFQRDALLGPFESGARTWDPFLEIEQPFDLEQLAGALIAGGEDGAAREWRAYARTFLAAVLGHCQYQRPSSRELWRLLVRASVEELREVVQGSPAQPFLEGENARMFASIRSVAGSALAGFEHLQRQRTRPFSVRRWVRDPGAGRALFLPYRANQIAALRTLIAAWLRLAIFEAMSQREGVDQRLWLVIDELDALGAIDGLKDALARLRKYGCRCVLGFQSISQVSAAYAGDANTIIENCGNTLILRCSASENGGTSAFASRLIGDQQVLRHQRSRGREGAGWGRASRSVTEQLVTEPAVLAAEIEQLPDLRGYFKPASSPAWFTVRLGVKDAVAVHV